MICEKNVRKTTFVILHFSTLKIKLVQSCQINCPTLLHSYFHQKNEYMNNSFNYSKEYMDEIDGNENKIEIENISNNEISIEHMQTFFKDIHQEIDNFWDNILIEFDDFTQEIDAQFKANDNKYNVHEFHNNSSLNNCQSHHKIHHQSTNTQPIMIDDHSYRTATFINNNIDNNKQLTAITDAMEIKENITDDELIINSMEKNPIPNALNLKPLCTQK